MWNILPLVGTPLSVILDTRRVLLESSQGRTILSSLCEWGFLNPGRNIPSHRNACVLHQILGGVLALVLVLAVVLDIDRILWRPSESLLSPEEYVCTALEVNISNTTDG